MKTLFMAAFLAVLATSFAALGDARGADAQSAFPVTVTHALGETAVPAAPRRVVSLGYNDQDFLYALGLAPVGVAEWWGRQPYATWPWAESLREALGATPAVSAGGGIDFEWVLVQTPDLIVATYLDLDRQTYAKLSRIAPVIGRPAGYPAWQAPWQEQLRLLDRATEGTTEKAERIIADIEGRLAAFRVDCPGFAGRSGGVAALRDGQFVLWSRDAAPGRFMASLGFHLPAGMERRADAAGWIRLSLEQAELIDLDVVVWPNDRRREVEAMPVYRNLRLFREQRAVWLGGPESPLAAALWFQSPLSIQFAIENLPPKLADALDTGCAGQ